MPRSLLAHSQMPMPAVQCLIACSIVKPLRRRLFSRNDNVDLVPAAQAGVGYVQKTIGIRWKINPHDFGFFVHDVVDKSRVLMRKAVVILAPHVRRQ